MKLTQYYIGLCGLKNILVKSGPALYPDLDVVLMITQKIAVIFPGNRSQ